MLTKVATKKTAGVLGDDLALNAQQVTGLRADRELPVVWAVAKGSAVNKAILVPAALGISALAPWAVTPLLMFGGAFLCFEGVEKLAHKFLHSPAEKAAHHSERLQAVADPNVDLVALERKNQSAVRTVSSVSRDVTIALGTSLPRRRDAISCVAIARCDGRVYVCRGIATRRSRADLAQKAPQGARSGPPILRPRRLMKTLSIAGTRGCFSLAAASDAQGAAVHHATNIAEVGRMPGVGGVLAVLGPVALDLAVGVAAGAVALLLVNGAKRLVRGKKSATSDG